MDNEAKPATWENVGPAQDDVAPVKRRGRPPKNPPTIENPTVPKDGDKPKRGRPPKKRGPDYDAPELRATLAKQLQGLHMIAATATGIPELAIAEPEAAALADAVAIMAKEYDLALNGKTGAAIQLAATAAMIYMPRFVAMKRRVTAHKLAPVADIVDKRGPVAVN